MTILPMIDWSRQLKSKNLDIITILIILKANTQMLRMKQRKKLRQYKLLYHGMLTS